jgi:hypothetical protein
LFIPDPDPDFFFLPIPDPGVKKAPDPGSGSATLIIKPLEVKKPVDLVDAEVAVSAVAERNRPTRPAQLLHGNDMVQVSHIAA